MDRSEQLQQIAKKIHKEKNKTLKYILLHELADALRKEGDLEYALRYYQGALIVAQNISDPKRVCETLFYLGSTADELGRTGDAESYYKQALEVAHNIDDSRMQEWMQRRIHGKFGMHYAREGNLALAAKHFTQANEKARKAKRNTIRISEEETPTNDITIFNERTTRVTQPPEPHPLAALNTEIKEMNRTRGAEQGIIFAVSVLCLAVFIILGKDILSLSPAYLLVVIVIIILLILLYYNAHRS